MNPPPQSFLLRLWREQADAPLRVTLISVAQPQEQRHFASLTPVQNVATWLARNTAGPAISSTVAIRPSGVPAAKALSCDADDRAAQARQQVAGLGLARREQARRNTPRRASL